MLLTFIIGAILCVSNSLTYQEISIKEIAKSQVDILFLYANYTLPEANSENITHRWEIQQKVQNLIVESNNSLQSSGVNMSWNSAGIAEVKLPKKEIEKLFYEILNSSSLSNFNKFGHDALKPVFNMRFTYNADVVVFIDIKNAKRPSNSGNKIGGKFNPYVRINNNEFNNGIFMHEVGHVLGLTHEMGSTLPYDKQKSGLKSLMASNCAYENKDYSGLFSGKQSYKNNTHFYSECNWDAVSVLNERANEISQWSNTVRRGQNAVYEKVPSKIIDISATDGCITWAIDEFNRLWIWDRYQWDEVKTERRFLQVAARNSQSVILVDSNNDFITYDTHNNDFRKNTTPEKVKRIATNFGGKKLFLGESKNIYEYVPSNNFDRRWVKLPNQMNRFVDVEVSGNGSIWALNMYGQVLQYDHNNWVIRSNRRIYAKELSVGEDGTIVFVDQNNSMHYSLNNNFSFQPIKNNVPSWCNCTEPRTERCKSNININRADNISVYNRNRIWALSSDFVYKYVGENGFQEVYEYGQRFLPKYFN